MEKNKLIKVNKITDKPENGLNFIVELFCEFVNKEMGKTVVKPKV